MDELSLEEAAAAATASPVRRARQRQGRHDDLGRRRPVREVELDSESVARIARELVTAADHSMRTPVANVVGYTELLLDGVAGDLTDMQADLVRRIEENSVVLLHLVRDMVATAVRELQPEAQG